MMNHTVPRFFSHSDCGRSGTGSRGPPLEGLPAGSSGSSQMESPEDDVTSKQEPREKLLPVGRLCCQVGFPLKLTAAVGRPCGSASRGCPGWL